MAFSLLLLRNFSSKNPNFHSQIPSLIRKIQTFISINGGTIKPFSTSSQQPSPPQTPPNLTDPKTSLSARMSFVFDEIDKIEKERNNKDETLQRIRSWRETKKKKNEGEEGAKLGLSGESNALNLSNESSLSSETDLDVKKSSKAIEVVHPWKEWIELMERLVQQNYFDQRRTDEEKMVQELSIDVSDYPDEGFDFSKDWMSVRTACLNFGRDRFDILRSISRQDIQILVGHGCPSTDRKVVFSAKLLRKRVHLDEGDVCSSCNLRSTCDRAYLLTLKEDEARTIDIMRILLAFGFDTVKETVENRSLLKMKSVKTVVRKLLHEVVKLSSVPIDPNLPPPVIKRPPPKVKQPPPPPKKRVGRDDVEMKKGDWVCPKCDFMNFAKNTVCLQCDAKRPKRQLLPGEWECPECNFLNYRRNMACFHCDHKRPNDDFIENQVKAREHGPKTRLEKVASMPGVSNAWNFDFDDNESDGADVAAFEYADAPRATDGSFGESHTHDVNLRGFGDESPETSGRPRTEGRGKFPVPDQSRSRTGFDDFDDEEDDINSYELGTPNTASMQEASSNLSEVEEYSEAEDFDAFNHHSRVQRGTNNSSGNRSSRAIQANTFSDSDGDGKDFGSDEGLSVYSNWKSSHIGASRNNVRDRGGSGPFRGRTFGSDNELESDSGSDDGMRQGRGSKLRGRNKWDSNRKGFQSGRHSDSEDGLTFDSESDDDNLSYSRNKIRGNKAGPDRRGNTSRDHTQFESGSRMSDRRNSFSNADRGKSFRGSHMNTRGSAEGGYGEGRGGGRWGSAGRGRQDGGFRHTGRMNDRRDSFDNADSGRQDGGFRPTSRMNDRRDSFDNADRGRSFRGSHRNNRESTEGGYGRGRMNGRQGNMRDFSRAGEGEGFGYRQRGRSDSFKDREERDFGDDRPRRRRIIER